MKKTSFLPDPNTILPAPVRQTSSQNTSPDVQITKVTPAKSSRFNPLTFQSREEIGPRVLITHFKSIPFKNSRQPLTGKSNDLYQVKGDRICYFRVVSFYLSGTEDYHKEI